MCLQKCKTFRRVLAWLELLKHLLCSLRFAVDSQGFTSILHSICRCMCKGYCWTSAWRLPLVKCACSRCETRASDKHGSVRVLISADRPLGKWLVKAKHLRARQSQKTDHFLARHDQRAAKSRGLTSRDRIT